MLVHNVFFWLKPEVTAAQAEAFRASLRALKSIETISSLYVGTPAPIDRPIVDGSYAACLTVLFKDMAAHDAYQVHPTHQAFIQANSKLWARVQVYDAQE